MAAIFTIRRGSGSLSPIADGELYLNKTTQSLQIGSGTETITLAKMNSENIGSFLLTGDIRLSGSIFLGNETVDNISAIGAFDTNLVPSGQRDIGTITTPWANVYANNISASTITGSFSGTIGGVDLIEFSTSVDSRLDSLESFASSQENKNSTLATYTASVNDRLDQLSTASGSVIGRLNNLESTSASINNSILSLNLHSESLNNWTSSIYEPFSTSVDSRLNTLETASSSNDGRLDNLELYTQSLNVAIQLTGSTVSFLGDIVVYGTQSIINSENLAVADNIIYLNHDSNTTNPDLGIVGNYNDGTFAHTGIYRDASDGVWRVFKGYVPEPSGTIDLAEPTFEYADFYANEISASSLVGIGNVTTYSASVDSRLDIVEASASLYFDFSQSVDNRLDLLESTSSYLNGEFSQSVDSRLDNLEAYTGSAESKFLEIAGVTASFSSSIFNLNLFTQSADGKFSTLATYTGSVETRMVEIGVVSGSLIISASAVSQSVWHLNNFTTSYYIDSASFDSRINTLDPGNIQDSLTELNNFTQSANDRINALESNSSSVNISIVELNSFTSSINTTIKDKLNVDGVLSGSAQIIANLPMGVVSGSSQIQLGSASGEIILGTQTTGSYVATITGDPTNGLTVAGSGVENAPITLTLSQNITTNGDIRFNSIGVGMNASTTAGRIDAANDVVAFSSSDIRFKTNLQPIHNALDKVETIGGYEFDWNSELKSEHGYEGHDIGVIAQEIEQIAPELVTTRDNGYKAVKYEKIVPILIQAIKELSAKVKELEKK